MPGNTEWICAECGRVNLPDKECCGTSAPKAPPADDALLAEVERLRPERPYLCSRPQRFCETMELIDNLATALREAREQLQGAMKCGAEVARQLTEAREQLADMDNPNNRYRERAWKAERQLSEAQTERDQRIAELEARNRGLEGDIAVEQGRSEHYRLTILATEERLHNLHINFEAKERDLAEAQAEIEQLKVDRNFEQVVVDAVQAERQRCLKIVAGAIEVRFSIRGAYRRIESGEEASE